MTWNFTLHLKGVDVASEELANALYEAGCNDATIGSCNGRVDAAFAREAPSLDVAIKSAIANVGAAGFAIERVSIEEDEVASWTSA